MTIEQEIFDRRVLDKDKLIAYGFQPYENRLVFHKTFLSASFEAQIFVAEDDSVTGKVIDLTYGDEYLGLRVGLAGGYANSIQEAYIAILEDIAKKCCHKLYFYTNQANRISTWIMDTYRCVPCFPWPRLPGHGLFTEGETVASIINVDRLIGNRQSHTAEELNIRAEGKRKEELLCREGILPSYYKVTKHWVAIPLDDRFPDEQIKELGAEAITQFIHKTLGLYPQTTADMILSVILPLVIPPCGSRWLVFEWAISCIFIWRHHTRQFSIDVE